MYYLITYRYNPKVYNGTPSFHYDIVSSVESWVEKMQEYDEEYILINAFPISEEFAKKWDGALRTM